MTIQGLPRKNLVANESYRKNRSSARKVSHIDFTDEPPEINAANQNLSRVTKQAWDALELRNSIEPYLFLYGDRPVRLEYVEHSKVTLRDLTVDRVLHELAQAARWFKRDRQGEKVPAKPPRDVAANVLATPNPPLAQLDRIVTVPIFTRKGELVSDPGYHAETRTLYRPPKDVDLLPVSDDPDDWDIKSARQLIVHHLLGDFPFVGDAERAHAVAALLLPFVRNLINGPTPLHLFEKPKEGTGASLLVQCICDVVGGHAVLFTEARSEEEWARKIFSALRSAPEVIQIDNVKSSLDSAALSAAITARYFGDRITGTSRMSQARVRCLWIATGNNPVLSSELVRRTIRIRLDARVENPEQRTDFRHPCLPIWVAENRNRLVRSCLTLVEAWIAAGRPPGTRTLGGFESWEEVMGGILEVAGIPGFLENREDHSRSGDADTPFIGFVEAWWDQYQSKPVTVGTDLIDLAKGLDLGKGPDHHRHVCLGKLLQKNRDRCFGNLRMKSVGRRGGVQRWMLVQINGEKG